MSWLEYIIFMVAVSSMGAPSVATGHELLHRKNKVHQICGVSLFFRMMHTNYFIDHRLGHHKYVATPLDPASAAKGEDVYSFSAKSIFYTLLQGYEIEAKRLSKEQPNMSAPLKVINNKVFQFKFVEYSLLAGIVAVWGLSVGIFFYIGSFILSFLLESVNYMEHYGLRRKEIAPGKYELTTIRHSWNAAHRWTNGYLLKVQRHSDHHENAYKPYQTLLTDDQAPQLPHGYTLMIIFSLCPPLFRKILDPIVDAYQSDLKPTKAELEYANKLIGSSLYISFFIMTALLTLYFI